MYCTYLRLTYISLAHWLVLGFTLSYLFVDIYITLFIIRRCYRVLFTLCWEPSTMCQFLLSLPEKSCLKPELKDIKYEERWNWILFCNSFFIFGMLLFARTERSLCRAPDYSPLKRRMWRGESLKLPVLCSYVHSSALLISRFSAYRDHFELVGSCSSTKSFTEIN